MTRVVVDASVILASLLSDGTTRSVLLGIHDLEFYAPEVVTAEITRHFPMVKERVGLPTAIVEAVLSDVLESVHVVPTGLFAAALPSARRRAERAHALHDEAYVALADVLGAPVWTYDNDFRRVQKVSVLSTREVLLMLGTAEETRR